MSDKQYQINKKKGNDTVIDIINLSYNELHSIIIGFSLGTISMIIIALTPTFFNILVGLVLLDKAISSTGYSISSNIIKIHPKNYAYLYTIRSEPWYYLSSLSISLLIGILLI